MVKRKRESIGGKRVGNHMGKFKETLVKAAREEMEREKKQERLRKRHHIQENVVVVEKSNMMKFFVRSIFALIRLVASVLLCVLATVGILALLYPNVRGELFLVFLEVAGELQKML